MNVHGFWSKANAKNRKDKSVYGHVLHAPPGRTDPQLTPEGTWRNHPDQPAVERALVAKCTTQVHRDS